MGSKKKPSVSPDIKVILRVLLLSGLLLFFFVWNGAGSLYGYKRACAWNDQGLVSFSHNVTVATPAQQLDWGTTSGELGCGGFFWVSSFFFGILRL